MHDAPECSGVVTTEPLVGALPGTIVKHARGLTNASRHPAEWVDLGRGSEPASTVRLAPLC